MTSRLYYFLGGPIGRWEVTANHLLKGEPLTTPAFINVVAADATPVLPASDWQLRGITSNERYVEKAQKDRLLAMQQGLGRTEATCAALIPIRKRTTWWGLTQSERLAIFEGQSHHNLIGMQYLPAIARRLHHCRDLSEHEPFDFITWFEYAPKYEESFNQLLADLRGTAEWDFVDREVDIRLQRVPD